MPNASVPLTLRQRLLILAAWVVFGLLESSKAYVAATLRGDSAEWSGALVGNMPWWLFWAAFTPAAFRLAARFRIDRPGRAVPLLVHFGASLIFAAAHLAVTAVLFYYTITRGGPFVRDVAHQVQLFVDGYLIVDMLTYCAVVGGYYAIDYHRRYREGLLAAARAEARAAEAHLDALRMELNPHFLFNALNAAAGLVRRGERDAAVRTLAELSDLLRSTLARQTPPEIALDLELAFLERYLAIERIRFGDRLVVDLRVDPEARRAMVPTLILLPLVENAVRHGIARSRDPGCVTISAVRDGDRLVLSVRNPGPDPTADGAVGRRGVGLSNTEARLAQRYGRHGRFELSRTEGGLTEARLTVPLMLEPVTVAHALPIEVA
jgi:two-component sensor histidine kinase